MNDLKTVRVAALLALPRRNPRLSVYLSCSVDVHVSKAKPSEGKNLFGDEIWSHFKLFRVTKPIQTFLKIIE